MSFGQPGWLWGLAALPLLAAALSLHRRILRRRWSRLADPRTAGAIVLGRPASPLAKSALLVAACGLILVALSRPRWGESEQRIETLGLDLIVAIDLSRSMLAEDVAPSRLAAARALARELVSRLPSDRVGLVGFAGNAATLCPMTFDRGAFELYLSAADPSIFSAQGTDLREAVAAARVLFERRGRARRVLIVLSDGEDQGDGANEALRVARGADIRVYAIGIGTFTGAPIPIRDDSGRVTSYHRDRSGQRVSTRLEEQALSSLAQGTEGAYVRATGIGQGVLEVADSIARIERDTLKGTLRQSRVERYQWPLALAFVLLALESGLTGRRGPLR